jgi:hypothetical protein
LGRCSIRRVRRSKTDCHAASGLVRTTQPAAPADQRLAPRAVFLGGDLEPVRGVRIGAYSEFSRRIRAQRRVGAVQDRMCRNPLRPRVPASRPGGVVMGRPPFGDRSRDAQVFFLYSTVAQVAKSRKKSIIFRRFGRRLAVVFNTRSHSVSRCLRDHHTLHLFGGFRSFFTESPSLQLTAAESPCQRAHRGYKAWLISAD